MDRFAEFVLRHRRWVTLGWLALFLAGLVAAPRVANRLTFDFSLPGQPGFRTEQALMEQFGGASTVDTLVPVVTVPPGQTVAGNAAAISDVFAAVRTQVPQTVVIDGVGAGAVDPSFVTADGRSAFALVWGPMPTGFGPGLETRLLPVLQRATAGTTLQVGLTSYNLLASGGESGGPSVLVETLFGGLGALAVLGFVFASFLALVPLLIAAVSILSTLLLVLALTTVYDVSFVVQFLVALIGLGVAIDYSLLLVSRWREERARGRSNHDATVIAVRTAGHAVLASGVTVAISLVALVVVPVPFLRSMGIGGMLIPLVSVAVVLTLLPVLLASIGPRVDVPRIRKEAVASRGWSSWARLVVRRPVVAVTAAGVALGLLIVPVTNLRIGQTNTASLASNGPAYDAFARLTDGGIGTGVLTPLAVLVPPQQASAVAQAAARVDGVRTAVVGPTGPDSAVLAVIPTKETVDSSGVAVVDRVRAAVDQVSPQVGVTGTGAVVEDYFSAVYDNFPYVLGLIALVTLVLLMRTFRSVLLPVKAVLLNLVSLAAVFGAVVLFWQQGNGSDAIFGVAATGAITFWLPVLIFAFLFGLSMDYEVFILARMREEYDATGSTSTAVVTGLGRTGRLVTSAALILFFAFAALASASFTDIKVLGTALGVGILLDATIVRALLVPALVSLFGRYNWWLPTGLARLLRVAPSPLPVRGEPRAPDERRPQPAGVG